MIVHETPGLIDIQAFTTLGMNVKPNTTNPIGYFGTGLKFAIATLVRLEQPLTIWIGDNPHEFFTRKKNFRGVDFNRIYMRRKRGLTRRWFSEALPFTTEFGKNWELWMAYRELHANTIDERGQTYFIADDHRYDRHNRTYFEVGGEAYEAVYKKRDEVFLPHALNPKHEIQVFPGKSEFAYYRGLKAHKLGKPSLFTYNFNRTMELTEDRTIKDAWYFDYYLKNFLLKSEDEPFIRQLVTAEKEVYEGNINWRGDDKVIASKTFIEIALEYAPKTLRAMFYTAPARIRSSEPILWQNALVSAIDLDDSEEILRIISEHKEDLRRILENNTRQAGQNAAKDAETKEVSANDMPL